MLRIVPAHQIKSRTEAINMTLKELAREAGLDPMAAYRVASGRRVRFETHQSLSDVLLNREKLIREHLAKVQGEFAIVDSAEASSA